MESYSQVYVFGHGDVQQSQPWISPPRSSASIAPEIMDTSSDDLWLLSLPDMPIQPTITAEAQALCELDVENAGHGKEKAHHIVEEETHSIEGVNPLRPTRHTEVHKISERKRRDRIKRKFRALQELMPHSTKKDKASILEDAAEYMRTLKLQVETMTIMKAQGSECAAPCMPILPIISGIGTGIRIPFGTGMLGVGCSAQYAPIFQVPAPSLAFVPSMPATPIAAFKGNSEQNLQGIAVNLAGFVSSVMCGTAMAPYYGVRWSSTYKNVATAMTWFCLAVLVFIGHVCI